MVRPQTTRPTSVNYYDVLKVSPGANAEEIRKAFKILALKYHPDKNPDRRQWSEKRVKELLEAFDVLGNPTRRAAFDRSRGIEGSAATVHEPFFYWKTDPESRALLILHHLLNARARMGVKILEEMEATWGRSFLVQHLERDDYLDCLFLLGEHYLTRREYWRAAERLKAFYLHEKFARFPRHYLGEVVRLLKDIYLRKLPRTPEVERTIAGLREAQSLGLSPADEALRLARLVSLLADSSQESSVDEARELLAVLEGMEGPRAVTEKLRKKINESEKFSLAGKSPEKSTHRPSISKTR